MLKCFWEKLIKMGPKGIGIEFAGFWVRLGAFLIDVIILGFAGIALYFFVPSPLIWVLFYLITSAYFCCLWWWRGQTLGKMFTGIKVVCRDGSSLSVGCVLLRYGGSIVCFLSVFIGFIWLAFDSHKQGWHDKIANTYVIKLPLKETVLIENYA